MDVIERTPKRSPVISNGMRLRVLSSCEIDTTAIACWRNLMGRSCHQNPFLAPEFLLPAWRWLSPNQNHILMMVEGKTDRRWLAAGGFSLNQVTGTLPWPHILAATSHYTFRTGLIVDADRAADALDVLLTGLTAGGLMQQTVEIPGLRLDSTLARELAATAHQLRYSWQVTLPRNVPTVFPEIVSDEYLSEKWSSSRRKSLRRSKARLESCGPVHLRLHTEPREIARAIETFLQLEHDSWKGVAGTSCVSNYCDEMFIREMIGRMADQNRILISELCAGNQVIASALNLTAGSALFAFKIGWDRRWAAASPGVMHEAELMLAARDRLRNFTLFDSCATESSYLASIWPERILVATGILHPSRWSRWSEQLLQSGRLLQRWIVAE